MTNFALLPVTPLEVTLSIEYSACKDGSSAALIVNFINVNWNCMTKGLISLESSTGDLGSCWSDNGNLGDDLPWMASAALSRSPY